MLLKIDYWYLFSSSVVWVLLVEGQLQPQFDQNPFNVTAIQGQDATLPCAVLNKGDFQIIWMNPHRILLSTEDRRVIDDSRMSVERPFVRDWNLLIRHVSVSDNGRYTCQINTDPIQIKRVWLTVHVPPQIDNQTSSTDKRVREGDTVELTCVTTGVPEPEIKWYRKTLQSNDAEEVVASTGEVLIIHNISRFCGGLYECEAQNGVGPGVRRAINIDVEFPPEVSFRTPKRIGQQVRKEALLECFVTAFPNGVSQWLKDGIAVTGQNDWKYRTEIYKEDHFTVALYLRILNLDVADFGEYTCEASNSLGRDEDYMYLYEYYIPTTPPPTLSTKVPMQQTAEPWKYNQNNYDDSRMRTAQHDEDYRSREQRPGPHLSGFLGAGEAYSSSRSIVLTQIYQNLMIVITLTLSIILTSKLGR